MYDGPSSMGAGRPEVTLSAVKSLASSGAFEKLTKNLKSWKNLKSLHGQHTEESML